MVKTHWKNTRNCYGWAFAFLHWLMVVWLLALIGLGLWMVSLDYYHPWYVRAPDWHRSLGVLLGVPLLVRLLWRWMNPPPVLTGTATSRFLARWVHRLFYVLMFFLILSGYLITTARGASVEVFDWFEIPAWFFGSAFLPAENLEDQAGWWHRWLAYGLVGLIVLHAAAALWHHFVLGDGSLWRIFGRCPTQLSDRRK